MCDSRRAHTSAHAPAPIPCSLSALTSRHHPTPDRCSHEGWVGPAGLPPCPVECRDTAGAPCGSPSAAIIANPPPLPHDAQRPIRITPDARPQCWMTIPTLYRRAVHPTPASPPSQRKSLTRASLCSPGDLQPTGRRHHTVPASLLRPGEAFLQAAAAAGAAVARVRLAAQPVTFTACRLHLVLGVVAAATVYELPHRLHHRGPPHRLPPTVPPQIRSEASPAASATVYA